MNQCSHGHAAGPFADRCVHKLGHNAPSVVRENHYDWDDRRTVPQCYAIPHHSECAGKGKLIGGSLKRDLVNLSHMRVAMPEKMDANHAP